MQPALDSNGFLLDWTTWDLVLADDLAALEGIVLIADHRLAIDWIREFYASHHHIPTMRVLVRGLAPLFPEDRRGSSYLYQLFPDAPLRRLCRVAGLPRPRHCL